MSTMRIGPYKHVGEPLETEWGTYESPYIIGAPTQLRRPWRPPTLRGRHIYRTQPRHISQLVPDPMFPTHTRRSPTLVRSAPEYGHSFGFGAVDVAPDAHVGVDANKDPDPQANMVKVPVYDLCMVPYRGTVDPTRTNGAARESLRGQLRVIDGIRTVGSKYGFGLNLRTRLDNVRFHLAAALSAIDADLRTGGKSSDKAADTKGLDNSTTLYLRELVTAKTEWNAWVLSAKAAGQNIPYKQCPNSAAVTPDTLATMQPRSISTALTFAGAAIVVGGLLLLMR